MNIKKVILNEPLYSLFYDNTKSYMEQEDKTTKEIYITKIPKHKRVVNILERESINQYKQKTINVNFLEMTFIFVPNELYLIAGTLQNHKFYPTVINSDSIIICGLDHSVKSINDVKKTIDWYYNSTFLPMLKVYWDKIKNNTFNDEISKFPQTFPQLNL